MPRDLFSGAKIGSATFLATLAWFEPHEAGSGSILVGPGRYDTWLVPDPWSLTPGTLPKFSFLSPPLCLGETNAICFFDVFSASVEIDARDIKVVLLRYHVLHNT